MRMMLVIHSLTRGGAERVMSVISNYWAEAGHEVSLVVIENYNNDDYFLRPGVTRLALDLGQRSHNPILGLWNNLQRLRRLRAAARRLRPQVVMSFMTHTNLLVLLAFLGINIPVIVSERVDPAHWDNGAFRNWLRDRLYPRAAAVVVQTEKVRQYMQRIMPSARLCVIANPVPELDPDDSNAHLPLKVRIPMRDEAKVICAMGRLNSQKGFDLLIQAFGKSTFGRPDWQLVIFGEGPERPALMELIMHLGLQARVHLPGQVAAVRKCLAETDIFVLSSRFEGFPNVLLEAMACGLPVISYDCPSGPAEIIRHGHDGLLVRAQDVDALAATLAELMANEMQRAELGRNAQEVIERFSIQQIMGKWDELLDRVTVCNVSI